jgi:hypothetical protein
VSRGEARHHTDHKPERESIEPEIRTLNTNDKRQSTLSDSSVWVLGCKDSLGVGLSFLWTDYINGSVSGYTVLFTRE